ncbi:MAG TPA: hypothetical protein DD387_11930 [Lachnoclostridium sp.]|nr:hypothetical protein [Lachnoclostridium sp.]
MSGLQGTDREIVAVLLQEKKPSGLIRESGDDTAKSIAALYFALRSMKRGNTFADVSVADVKFRLQSGPQSWNLSRSTYWIWKKRT